MSQFWDNARLRKPFLCQRTFWFAQFGKKITELIYKKKITEILFINHKKSLNNNITNYFRSIDWFCSHQMVRVGRPFWPNRKFTGWKKTRFARIDIHILNQYRLNNWLLIILKFWEFLVHRLNMIDAKFHKSELKTSDFINSFMGPRFFETVGITIIYELMHNVPALRSPFSR